MSLVEFVEGEEQMLKMVGLAKRKEGMSPEEFHRHWVEVHPQIAKELPGLRRYVVSPFTSDLDGNPPEWDGMAELWFDDRESLERARQSAAWAASGEDRKEFQSDVPPLLSLCYEEHEIHVG